MTAPVKRWFVTAPAPAHTFDGIGDYADRLARALSAMVPTTVFVGGRDDPPDADAVAGVWHQYSPSARSHDGDRWVRRMASEGQPTFVTIHEYWPPPDGSLRRLISRWQHRRRLSRVVARAAGVIVTQEIAARELREAGVVGDRPLYVIPVGSNITEGRSAVARTGGLVLFGQPAAMQPAALSALARWLDAPGRPPLTWLGRSVDELQAAWQAAGGTRAQVTLRGASADGDVAAVLANATLGLAPYADGVSARRTTLAAMLQHGVPVAGLRGVATDSWLGGDAGLELVADDRPSDFVALVARLCDDAEARERAGRRGRVIFEQRMTWERIAAAYAQILDGQRS
jgi:glycosyltransferase involved in cell wall biosynthesis